MIQTYNLQCVKVSYDPEIFSKEEIEGYLETSKARFPNLKAITFKPDGKRIFCKYVAQDVPFERIRRITGYLTGDLTSWNNAKRSEESERVKHEVTDYD